MTTLFSTESFNRPKKVYKKTNFLKLTDGKHLVRILKQEMKSYPTHFMRGMNFSILCLGENCPICDRNRKIMFENPKDFRNNPAYINVSWRMPMYVYDRTPVKVCPNCGVEHKKMDGNFAVKCDACNTLLTSVDSSPSNKVKLLSASDTLARHLATLEAENTDAEENPIGLANYDVVLVQNSEKRNDPTTPVAKLSNTDVVTIPEEEIPTGKGFFELNINEIQDVLNGVSLRDILNARSESVPSELPKTVDTALEEKTATVKSLVNSLFEKEDEDDDL